MTEKLIINFAPTGMVPTKKDNPHVPITPSEIIETVHQAYETGITMVHVHARDPLSGQPDYREKTYGKILNGIRQHCPDLPVCVSLSGRNVSEFEKRAAPLSLQPDLGSLTLSSLNFRNQASINTPDMIRQLLEEMNSRGVTPELEVFDLGMLNYLNYLIRKKWLSPPYYINFIFGNIFSMQPSFAAISAILQDAPKEAYYSFGGIGRHQLTAQVMAMGSQHAGVRVGLEDNLYLDDKRQKLASNLDLLQRIHSLAKIAERKWMKPAEFGNLGFYNRSGKIMQS